MPRDDEPQVSNTPFARVLTAFMWSKTPPWSATKTAAVLGIHRTRVANWVYHGITPEWDTLLAVMARLGIPMRVLLDAYAADGVPVPPLDVDEAQLAAEERERVARLGEAGSAFYPVPAGRRGRQADKRGASTKATDATEAAEVAEAQRQRERAQEWSKMLEHTREVMRMTGMPEAAVEALLESIKDTRDGKPTEAERRIAEEHSASPSSSESRGEDHTEGRSQGQGHKYPTPNSQPQRPLR